MLRRKKKKTKNESGEKTKCERCRDSKCCSYLTQQITTPRSMQDFDTLLWQVSHTNVSLFQDSRGWYLLINNPCQHVLANGSCGIYAKRPKVCRDHSNEHCEFDEPAKKGYKRFFDGNGSLERFCRKKFKTWNVRHCAL